MDINDRVRIATCVLLRANGLVGLSRMLCSKKELGDLVRWWSDNACAGTSLTIPGLNKAEARYLRSRIYKRKEALSRRGLKYVMFLRGSPWKQDDLRLVVSFEPTDNKGDRDV